MRGSSSPSYCLYLCSRGHQPVGPGQTSPAGATVQPPESPGHTQCWPSLAGPSRHLHSAQLLHFLSGKTRLRYTHKKRQTAESLLGPGADTAQRAAPSCSPSRGKRHPQSGMGRASHDLQSSKTRAALCQAVQHPRPCRPAPAPAASAAPSNHPAQIMRLWVSGYFCETGCY